MAPSVAIHKPLMFVADNRFAGGQDWIRACYEDMGPERSPRLFRQRERRMADQCNFEFQSTVETQHGHVEDHLSQRCALGDQPLDLFWACVIAVAIAWNGGAW
jgi:hypothetical protein